MIFSTFFYCGLYPGKTMNDPHKQRIDDLKEASPFRTHRIHAINSDWYFLTREGQNIGPFPNKKAAEDSLAEFLKTVKKDE
tara:strand:- start:7585 stop:7827 length:243 start_codon:yes stop_codon:yes gene_type:complete